MAHIWRDPVLRMVVFAVLLFGSFAASIGVYQSLIAVTVFGMSDGAYALVLAAALIVSAAASVGVGIITDQRPSRRIMAILAAASIVAGASVVSLGQSVAAFVVAHVILLPISATIFGQLFAISRLMTASLASEDRDAILAMIRATFAVPFVLLLPLWGRGFEAGLPLMAIYPALGLFGAALLVLVLRDWPADAVAPWVERKSGLGFRASLGELAAAPVLIRVLLIGAIHSGAGLTGVLLGLIFAQTEGRGTADTGLFFALFVLVEIGVTLMIGQILRLMRRLYVIAAGVFIYAAFLALLPFLAPTPFVWLLILPAGVGGAMVYALAIGYLQDLLGQRAGAGAALIALQRLGAEGLAAGIFALGAAFGGYHVAAVIGAGVMSLAMVAILRLDRTRP